MVRVIFIGGLGRSGTALLERILGELPGVCPLGEVVNLWRTDLCDDERCGCGSRFSHCRFWRKVGDHAFGGWHSMDPVRVLALRDAVEHTRHIPRLAGRRLPDPHAELVSEYASYYARLYRAAAQVGGAHAVVDSSRHASLAYCLRWSDQVDLRVVHMMRQGGPPDPGQRLPALRPLAAALDRPAVHHAAFGLLRRCGVPVHRVRYEQLVAEPVPTVRRIAEFAGLDGAGLDAGALDFLGDTAVRLGPCHSAGSNPIRFVTGELPLRHDRQTTPDEGTRDHPGPRPRGALTTAAELVEAASGKRSTAAELVEAASGKRFAVTMLTPYGYGRH